MPKLSERERQEGDWSIVAGKQAVVRKSKVGGGGTVGGKKREVRKEWEREWDRRRVRRR